MIEGGPKIREEPTRRDGLTQLEALQDAIAFLRAGGMQGLAGAVEQAIIDLGLIETARDDQVPLPILPGRTLDK